MILCTKPCPVWICEMCAGHHLLGDNAMVSCSPQRCSVGVAVLSLSTHRDLIKERAGYIFLGGGGPQISPAGPGGCEQDTQMRTSVPQTLLPQEAW